MIIALIAGAIGLLGVILPVLPGTILLTLSVIKKVLNVKAILWLIYLLLVVNLAKVNN